MLPFTAGPAAEPAEETGSWGVFYRFTASEAAARHVFPAGRPGGLARFTCCHRYEPNWMKAAAGTRLAAVPIETQWLLIEREDGGCTLLVPLLDGDFRCSLQGSEGHGLELVAESGDPAVVTDTVVGLFVASGPDPYDLMERAAPALVSRMGTGRLRREKALPGFADLFGWCTWDAFYQDVAHEKVREGLESFAAGGVSPRVVILDDGWQSVAERPSGERRLTAFSANDKFPGDLAPTVSMAKEEFGVRAFLVWHALNGYWGGVDDDALSGYGVRSQPRRFSPGILHHVPTYNTKWWGEIVGTVPPEGIYRFFHDYHRHLRRQGVDGVKVDTQATIEGVAHGLGGRVSLMRAYREALEGSVHTHFQGELINCMSCSNDMLFSALSSTVTRTSTDFWPNRPESHGLHVYVNAQVSAWFGEFIHPDWDMFQSGHPMGAYHAAARAVGGCPVYVSDKPGAHDFDLLRKLVLPDGTVLRALDPGRPTRDCLFHDPTRQNVLLKVFNRNEWGWVVGAFNARFDDGGFAPVTGQVSHRDLPEMHIVDDVAVYAHFARELRVLNRDDVWEITLPQLSAEVFTFVPIMQGVGCIGLANMLNSSGAVLDRGLVGPDPHYRVVLRGGGRFLAWCLCEPTSVSQWAVSAPYTYDPERHVLEVEVTDHGGGREELWLDFGASGAITAASPGVALHHLVITEPDTTPPAELPLDPF
jgi:raffinose synthase